MNQIDPSSRFTPDAVRQFDDAGNSNGSEARLGSIARQVASQYRRETMSPVMVSGKFRALELLLLLVAGALTYASRFGISGTLDWSYVAAITGGSVLAVILLEFTESYQMATLRNPAAHARTIAFVWSGAFALMALATFFMKNATDFSRLWFVGWYVSGLLCIFGLRVFMSRLIRRWARNGVMERRAVIVGGGKAAETLIRSLEKQADNDIRICGIFDDRDDTRSPPIVAGYPKLGNISELIEFARAARIDMLIVSLPLTAESRVLSMLKKLWVLPVDIRLSAHSSELRFRPRAYSFIGSVPMLDIFDKPINDWDSVAKRAFDVVFSLLGIAVFSPIMILTAIAIKLDSKGPVLFRQKRHGFNNEVIDVYKFRSMYADQSDPTAKRAVTKGRPAGHARRPHHPQDVHRRTAAILQFAVWQPLTRRPAAPRGRRAIPQPALYGSRRRLFRPPQGQARRDRLGTDQRLARRDGYRREGQEAHRIRPVLHRELVPVVRPPDTPSDTHTADEHGKRVLSALAHEFGERGPLLPKAAVDAKVVSMLVSATVFIGVFLSGFVIREPAPYEIYMVALIAIWGLFGLRISQSVIPLLVLLVVFNIGGMIAMTQMETIGDTPLYLAVSFFLALTAVFYASVLEARPALFKVMFLGWTIAAVATSAFGILGYFHAFPGAEMFTKYERAAGVFQDPNVFGPFITLPGVYLLHRLLTGPVSRMPLYAIPLLIVAFGLFLSFSRGAWGLFAFSTLALALALFIHHRSSLFRLRLLVMGGVAILLLALGLIVALQIPEIAELFTTRAQLVQEYNSARLGRFARHAIGFMLATERPLGIGPLVFGLTYGEDTHNIWLKALMDYGWLGFAAWFTMIVWTLAAGFRILFRDRSWQPYLLCAYIVLVGHVLLGTVIDTDHWRHFYLLLGMVWGGIALEWRHQRAPAKQAWERQSYHAAEGAR